MDVNDDNQMNDDIEMLNTNDVGTGKQLYGTDTNLTDSPIGSVSSSAKPDSLDDSFLLESDTKTPGEILDEFCMKLQDVNTTLPDPIVNFYMRKAGFIVNDPKLVKIVSIASQKFVSEIVNDVMQYQKLKTKSTAPVSSASNTTAASGTSANPSTSSSTSAKSKSAVSNQAASSNAQNIAAGLAAANASSNLTLTLEDLSHVLADYGINVKKPYYFM